MADVKVRYINPDSLAVPRGYSHVVETSGGRTIYVAGQVALDQTGHVVGLGNFEAQAEQVFKNLRTALAAVGGDLSNIVKTTTFIRNMSANLPVLRKIRERYLSPAPANTLIEISSLVMDELLLESEAVAVVPN